MKLLKRELLVALAILAATLLLLFPATYVVGVQTFGDYGDDGSLGKYLGSLFSALWHGDPAIWFFTLTPLISISLMRLGIQGFRRL